jgi:hypothetical protein
MGCSPPPVMGEERSRASFSKVNFALLLGRKWENRQFPLNYFLIVFSSINPVPK